MMDKNFESICIELIKLQSKKNADYGDSFNKSMDEFGIIAALIPLTNKINRLKSLTLNNDVQVKSESIDDTLRDLACYAIMTIVNLKK